MEQGKDPAVVNPPAGGQPATPPPSDMNAILAQNAEMAKRVTELTERINEAQKKITEESTARATLEQRYTELEQQPPQQPVQGVDNDYEYRQLNDMAQQDPAMAIKHVGTLIKNARDTAKREALEEMRVEMQKQYATQQFLNSAKARIDKEGLAEWENEIAATAKEKILTRRIALDKAVDETIGEFKSKREKLVKSVTPPKEETPLPNGAKSDTGNNPPPAPPAPEEKEETTSDLVNKRIAMRFQKVYKAK